MLVPSAAGELWFSSTVLSSQSITDTKNQLRVLALNVSASTAVVSVNFCASLTASVRYFLISTNEALYALLYAV